MRYWYDTEFLERGPSGPVSLISIGVVAEDGREFYAVHAYAPWLDIQNHGWLMDNVVPSLPVKIYDQAVREDEDPAVPRIPGTNKFLDLDPMHRDADKLKMRHAIARQLYEFLTVDDHDPELWAWYASYDHVVLSQIYGTMHQMGLQAPRIPHFTNDVKQEHARLGSPRIPIQKFNEHNALADAQWCRDVHLWLSSRES